MKEQKSHEQLFLFLKKKVGSSIWALEKNIDTLGNFFWIAYVDDKKKIKKIPSEWNNNLIVGKYLERPKL